MPSAEGSTVLALRQPVPSRWQFRRCGLSLKRLPTVLLPPGKGLLRMPRSPDPARPGIVRHFTERERQAVAARRSAEDGLVVVSLQQHFTKEAIRLEAEAAADTTKDMALREIEVLNELISKVDGSAAAAKIVGDRMEHLSRTGSMILSRRLGP